MTIRTIFKQHAGGATKRKDRPELTNDSESGQFYFPAAIANAQPADCPLVQQDRLEL